MELKYRNVQMFYWHRKTKHDPKVVFYGPKTVSLLRRFVLDRADIGCLQAFGAGFDFKLYTLIFSKSSEALGFDFAEMRKKIVAALLGGDKAKALGIVEPFDGTGLSAHLVFL
jgi:hypothetical protein